MDGSTFRLDAVAQRLDAESGSHYEGIAFSPSGNVIAIADIAGDAVRFLRRERSGSYRRVPDWSPLPATATFRYPHDVAFGRPGTRHLLAVTQRDGVVSLFASPDGSWDRADPAFEITGPASRLHSPDAVAFVPPRDEFLAVCNLESSTITFFRIAHESRPAFSAIPVFELADPSLWAPDGIGFSPCGRFLAVANHGRHTVSVYERPLRSLASDWLRFGPEPVSVIRDSALRYPHSVAFTPAYHLAVTSAGANHFSVYPSVTAGRGITWSGTPVTRRAVSPEASFIAVNSDNAMEGGPKGIAIHGSQIALCVPEAGALIYRFHESTAASARPGVPARR